jgi:hypothetical protein
LVITSVYAGENMAERVGFEPTLEFPLNTLSKRAPSATRPSLRGINTLALAAASGGNTLMSFTSFLKGKAVSGEC